MKRIFQMSLGIVMVVAALSVQAQQTLSNVPAELVSYPDQILFNGKIATMSDPTLNNSPGRMGTAMAVRGERIIAVGSDQEIMRLAGSQTKKMDLKGHT